MARDRYPASDRAHVDDDTAPTFPHARKYSLDHPDHTKVVCFEQGLHPIDRHILERAAATDPRIVDENVDVLAPLEHLAHTNLHGRRIVNIYRHWMYGERLFRERLCQFASGPEVAHAGIDVVTLACEVQSGGQANACARAGNQHHSHGDLRSEKGRSSARENPKLTK